MPKYRAKVKMLIAHESRVVEAGEVFETTFPKAKTKDGEVEMRLGDNLELVKDEPEAAPAKKGKASDLV